MKMKTFFFFLYLFLYSFFSDPLSLTPHTEKNEKEKFSSLSPKKGKFKRFPKDNVKFTNKQYVFPIFPKIFENNNLHQQIFQNIFKTKM